LATETIRRIADRLLPPDSRKIRDQDRRGFGVKVSNTDRAPERTESFGRFHPLMPLVPKKISLPGPMRKNPREKDKKEERYFS
jgi:hypothetical protein